MSTMKVLIDMFKEEAKGYEDWFRGFLERRNRIQRCVQDPQSSPEEVWEAVWEGQVHGICDLLRGYTKKPFQNSQINLQQLHNITQDTYQALQQDPLDYNALRGCRDRFVQLVKDNRYRPMFYRAVCGLDHKARFSTVVAENRWWSLYPYLQKVSGNALLPSGDWFETNVSFTEWFDRNHRNDLINAIAGTQLADDYGAARCLFTWYLYELLTWPQETFLPAKIYYGAPGTGKTYKAWREGELSFQYWAKLYLPDVCTSISPLAASNFVVKKQFHPSYGYENFIEGLMPVTTSQGTPHFDLIDRDFKYFCRKAGVLEIWLFEYRGDAVTPSTTLDTLYTAMQNRSNWRNGLEIIIKRFTSNENHPLAVFWREYCDCLYQALAQNKYRRDAKLIDYLPPFTFVADEINRADLSRVLGETMYCLEYRGAGGRVRTQYALLANSDPQKKKGFCYQGDESWFFVPHNVYFIGTMNEIDRNIEIFDLALRRRFTFMEQRFGEKEMRDILRDARLGGNTIDDLVDRIKKVNEKISKDPELGPAYQIGHGYFTHLRQPGYSYLSSTDLRERFWNRPLKPLLYIAT